MNIDTKTSGDTNILTASQSNQDTNRNLSQFDDIEYLMFHQIPPQYRVREQAHRAVYSVFDAAGKVNISVRFDTADHFARYVLYLNDEGPEATNFSDCAAWRIQHEVDKKLNQWIGQSNRRKDKAIAEPNIGRVLAYYEEGLPMAIVSPDLHTPTDPIDVKQRRLQFKRELDKNLRPMGFGYHQVRHNNIISYIIYGKPNKKSEQLLKIVAAETGRKYGQKAVLFSDLNGQIYYIHTANTAGSTPNSEAPYVMWDTGKEIYYGECKLPLYAKKDILNEVKDYFCFHANFADAESIRSEEPAVTSAFKPIEQFNSTSTILRRRNACALYCSECWDEEAQTYHFDIRYHTYF